jgi:hypothetical protein
MNWNYTPVIYGAHPPVVYYGQIGNILMNTREAPRGKKADELPVSVTIDGFRMDHEGYLEYETNLSRWAYLNVQGIV